MLLQDFLNKYLQKKINSDGILGKTDKKPLPPLAYFGYQVGVDG